MELFQGRMDLAVKYGADVAIFVHNVVYWVEKNAANRKHMHDDRYWTYNSARALCELYPLWSRDQIKRIIKKCEDAGLILIGNFNEKPMDRTQWYSPSDEILTLYGLEHLIPIGRNRPMDGAETPNAKGEIAPAIPSIYQEDTQEPPYSPPKGDEPKAKKQKRKAKAVPEWQPERFEKFWAAYPRDEDRAKAVEQWDALPRNAALMEQHGNDPNKLLDEIARGLQRHLMCEEWKKDVGIPYAFRWLRDRRWREKQKTAPAPEQFRPPPRSSRTEVVDGEEVVVFDV